MRRYTDLTPEEQAQALEQEKANLLQAIVEGAIRFNDDLNGDNLQATIDKAIQEAERMRTPWFAHEYVMEAVGDEIESLSIPTVEDAWYPEPGETVIRL